MSALDISPTTLVNQAARSAARPSESFRKRAMESRSALAGEALFRLTRFVISSVDLRAHFRDEVLQYKQQSRPIIFVCWHGHDFANLGVYQPLFGTAARGAIMVRANSDGRVLHHFGRRMGIEVVSLGSNPESAQWARGVVTMINLVKHGVDGMLAVDGPDGPAYQVKPGAAFMAQRAGAVLVPTFAVASRGIRLRNRWDQMLIPVPGARLDIHFGPAIDARPPDGARPSVEEMQARIREILAAEGRRSVGDR